MVLLHSINYLMIAEKISATISNRVETMLTELSQITFCEGHSGQTRYITTSGSDPDKSMTVVLRVLGSFGLCFESAKLLTISLMFS